MGYAVKKRNRWYAVVYEGLDPLTGRDRRRWHPAVDEADARRVAASLRPPARSAAHGMTLARFMRERWLPGREGRLRPTTAFRYWGMTERYILPRLGRVPVRRLTVTHLIDLYAALRRDGRQDGAPLAPKTVLNVHQILRTALGDAERQGLVARNVAALMDPPCHGLAPEQRCWNLTELQGFLAVAMTHRLGPALWLAAMTGMRRGEVVGLHWDDVDFAAARLSVQRSVTCTGYAVHVTRAKTWTSRRPIDLDARTLEVLADWRAAQREELGGHQSVEVFTTVTGVRIHPHLMSQAFDRLQVKAAVPRIRLHDVRHTHATLLLKAGVALKVVSERLGHSSPAFTMAVYQHVLPGMQREAAETFARLITGDAAASQASDVVPVDSR
ncbi:MAG TPA: tyrosine-type recombinase/integrase [Egibacteraceae bacterium]|jgi:integrase|nr:tyrosine-type recombinase/integrase [Egibacteraceae bacterium]